MQRFLPFLPDGDTAGGEALAVISDDLDWLLTTDAGELWSVAKADASLVLLIGTFLQYARRPYDEGFQQQSATELSVWQRMLPLLHRLICGEERGAPPKAERAAFLSRLLDLPRLLDICALYGATAAAPDNNGSGAVGRSQLAQVVAAALQLLLRLATQAAQAAPVIAQNLGQVAEACLAAAGKAGRDAAMMQSLQDGVAYLRDTCLTLSSLLHVHPPAASLLLQQGPELIEALGAVHDQLLPAVQKAARGGGGSGSGTSPQQLLLLRQACHVELASERLAQQLLLHCYLQPPAPAAATGSGSSSSGAGSSSSGAAGGSPVGRGEALLHALMLLGHREDEAGSGGGAGGGMGGGLSLSRALAQRHGLGGSIEAALHIGYVSLDDAQTDYVAALLGVSSLAAAPGPPLASGGASSGRGGGGSGSSRPAAPAVDMGVLKSKIQQVKDLLPDYGDGFIAACLQQLGGNPEQVLNALLEGNLPPMVADLDQQLSLEAWQAAADRQAAAAAAAADGKGKQPAGAAAPLGSYDADFPAHPGLPGSSAAAGGSSTAAALAAARAKAENRTARYLDTREETYREALVLAATAAQYEMDDEYDDSFDDLVTFGADGVAEVEETAPAAVSRGGGGGTATAAAQRAAQGLQAAAPAFQPGGKQQQQQQQQQRGPKTKGSKLWVLDGRIYNYAKPGAQEVSSRDEADAVLAAAQQAAQEIHGLGPGGNKPWRTQQQEATTPAGEEGAGGGDAAAAGGSGGGGRGGGRGGGGGGHGRGRGDDRQQHRFKDQHKAGIANHHRKDRAVAKQGRGMF